MNNSETLSFETLRDQAKTIKKDINRRVATLGEAGLQIDQYYAGLSELGFDPRAIRSGIGDGMSYHQVTASKDSTDLVIVA